MNISTWSSTPAMRETEVVGRRPRFRGLFDWLFAHRGLLGIGVLVACLGLTVAASPNLLTAHLQIAQIAHTAGSVVGAWRDTLLSPWYLSLVALLVVLERIMPARVGEGSATVGAAQDWIWLVFFPVFHLTIVRCYYILLSGATQQVFHGFALHVSTLIGAGGALAFAFVASDFLSWLTHLIRHRVRWFWHFHEIHHSQRSMNVFANERVHFAEAMIATTIVFVPSALLGLPGKQIVVLATVSLFYQRFFHANIRTNLGPLRFILVTPQSHRVHHANMPEYYDTNFGVVFSIWDRLFRTQHADARSYPPVGLPDTGPPVERSARPRALFVTYFKQLVYPFRAARRHPAGNHELSRV